MSTLKVDAIVDKSSGNTATINGQTPSSSNMQGRNLLINGQFQVWQRGTSITSNNSDKYTSDRWQSGTNGGEDVVYSRQFTNTSDETPIMRVRRAGTASGRMYLIQMMETSVLDFCRGKTVTFSFKARKHADFDATFVSRIATQTNESPRSDTVVQNNDATRTLTTSFQTFSQSLTLTSGSDSANGFRVEFVAEDAAGGSSNYYYEVKDCQLEVGDTVTEIEHLPYGQMLPRCQRYYYRLTPGSSASAYCVCNNNSTAVTDGVVNFPVSMRSIPTAVDTTGTATDYRALATANGGSTANITCNAVPSFVRATLDSSFVRFNFASSSLQTGGGGLHQANTTASFLAWSSEL